jgi:uncharacterized protein YecA (UPF0149 family)
MNFIDDDYSDENAIKIRVWVESVFEEFTNSIYFTELNEEEQDACGFLLGCFFEYCYSYCLVAPGALNKRAIDEIMLDLFPRKISADKATFESFAPVMDKFLLWSEENGYIRKVANLRKRINELSDTMISYSQDRDQWGPEKSMVMAREHHVIEQEDYATYVATNDEPYQREHPKIGRNDPCSCGSGKKYKKCCLNNCG